MSKAGSSARSKRGGSIPIVLMGILFRFAAEPRLTATQRVRNAICKEDFANLCERTFPSSQRRGGRDIDKMLRSILYGADGVVRPAKLNIAPN